MDITFHSSKFEKTCNESKALIKKHGSIQAKLIRQRLDDLAAAENLAVMRCLPQARCHELKGNRAGQLSVDLNHPYRLIFTPNNDPLPQKVDGGLDWNKTTAIQIKGVPNTLSNCKAVSGVIDAFPLTISLIVFLGRPVRSAN